MNSIIDGIKKGEWSSTVEEYRKAVATETNKDRLKEVKSSIPCFTISGIFKGGRSANYLEQYSQVIGLDYDDIEDVESLRQVVNDCDYTYASFVSPTGNGLKVFVRVNSSSSEHEEVFSSVKRYYDNLTAIESDIKVKDLPRLCFVSYDPLAHLNEFCKVYNTTTAAVEQELGGMGDDADLKWLWEFTLNNKAGMTFSKGSRNSFLHLFASNGNRKGFDYDDILAYSLTYKSEDLNAKEITDTVRSAYVNNAHEHGKYAPADTALSAVDAVTMTEADSDYYVSVTEEFELADSPAIPEWIFESLPYPLDAACRLFEGRKRDMILTSALSVIGGGLYHVSGVYNEDKTYPNIYSFVVAPPGSGKGKMKHVRKLALCFHKSLIEQHKRHLKQYKKNLLDYEARVKAARKDPSVDIGDEPIEPSEMVYFISGNSSASKMIDILDATNGVGCLFETESDVLSTTMKQDWGDFSSTLRQNYHHEPVTKSRKSSGIIEIEEPKMSVCLSGTPSNVLPLIKSNADGLMSRFMFYCFSNKEMKFTINWGKKADYTLDERLDELNTYLCEHKYFQEGSRYFNWSEHQVKPLEKMFHSVLEDVKDLNDENLVSLVTRGGLMAFKIAMILSALRTDDKEMICSDEDFKIATTLVLDVYLKHNFHIYRLLNKRSYTPVKPQERLFNEMPKSFATKEALEWGKKAGFKERSIQNFLDSLMQSGRLLREKKGFYTKK
ncbi:MAG: DUF3987 domain-containing protein [Chitinophagales bacterium]